MAIEFYFEKTITLRNRTRLKKFIQLIFKTEGLKLSSLAIIFCSDKYLLSINQQFLQHDYYTDIITFDLSPNNFDPIIGEIYISVDRVKENARNFNVSTINELHRVIFHGVLHLCGHKDKTVTQNKEMRKKESHYLKKYDALK